MGLKDQNSCQLSLNLCKQQRQIQNSGRSILTQILFALQPKVQLVQVNHVNTPLLQNIFFQK